MLAQASDSAIQMQASAKCFSDELGITYTVGGSLARSFAGEPRSTVDIDIVARILGPQVPALAQRLAGQFYVDEHSLRRAVSSHTSTNLIHQPSQIKVDLFVAGGTPLDDRAYLETYAPMLGVADLLSRVLTEGGEP